MVCAEASMVTLTPLGEVLDGSFEHGEIELPLVAVPYITTLVHPSTAFGGTLN